MGQAKTLKKFMFLGVIYYNRALSRQHLIWISDRESLQPTTTTTKLWVAERMLCALELSLNQEIWRLSHALEALFPLIL